MPSANEALEAYLAGRLKAERVVAAVTEAYYGEQGARSREQLRPILDVIERAHPGVIELASAPGKPGFAVRLAERAFPKEYEPALRAAVEAALSGARRAVPAREPAPGVVARLVAAVRRFFTASA